MDYFVDINFSAPASRQPYPPYGGEVSPHDELTPYTSRSASPISSCPSPTSSVSSYAHSTSIAELSDQLGRQSFDLTSSPKHSSSSLRRTIPIERRRNDRLSPGHHDAVRSRRQAYSRIHHDSRRRVNIGSLMERLMVDEQGHCHRADSTSSTSSQDSSSTASAYLAVSPASKYTARLDIPAREETSTDSLQAVDAALQGRVRVSDLLKATAKRRTNAVQKDVRMRKKPRFKP